MAIELLPLNQGLSTDYADSQIKNDPYLNRFFLKTFRLCNNSSLSCFFQKRLRKEMIHEFARNNTKALSALSVISWIAFSSLVAAKSRAV
jgi:hypothetical protein